MADASVALSFGQLLAVALAPAAVTGIVGITAGVVGPWFLEARKKETERKNKRAEKFEELVAALFEHKHWLDVMEQIWVFGEPEKRTVSPFAKVHAISRVYFPLFEARIKELDALALAYQTWMYDAAKKRIANKGMPSIDGLEEVYNPYATKLVSLLNELGEFAKREFQ